MFVELIFVTILLGVYPILIKSALNYISPPTFMFGFGIALFIFEIIYGLIHYKFLQKDYHTIIRKKFIIGIFLLTGFVVSLMNFLNYGLLKKYKVYFVTAFLSIYPLVTALLSYYFLKEKISKYAFIGILFVVLGIMIINFSESSSSLKN